MEITAPRAEDWQVFRDLAHMENWRVPQRELDLYRGPLSGCAFVLRREDEPCGFVTVVGYERNGWIGNLLVPPGYRGRGYGTRLFDYAVDLLQRQGVESLWLTASDMGRPLYERSGFRVVGGVERWTLVADGRPVTPTPSGADCELLCRLDSQVWGESRRRLLAPLAQGGQVLACGDTAALLQTGDGIRVLGPWLSGELCPRENRLVLAAALAAAEPGAELAADVLEASPVTSLLAAAGFAVRGRCDLMVLGPLEGVDLRRLIALASLGSMG